MLLLIAKDKGIAKMKEEEWEEKGEQRKRKEEGERKEKGGYSSLWL